MLIEIDPVEPEGWLVARAAEVFKRGGVGIVPTDTVYGLACGISHIDAVRRIYKLKNMDETKPLALLLDDISSVGTYARGITNPAFRLMKRVLPGPYTFIFRSMPVIPKIMLRKRKTIGIRIADNPILQLLLKEIGEPLMTTSVRTPDDDFINDPMTIDDIYGAKVDVVIDGGPLAPDPSTIVDFSSGEPELLREGKGPLDSLDI